MGEVISGVGAFLGGKAQQAEGERAFKIAQIQADETSAARTAELRQALGNIQAALVGSMRDPTAPTAAALRRDAIKTVRGDLNRERTNILLRGFAERRAGQLAAQTGAFALGAGIASFASEIAKAAIQPGGGGGSAAPRVKHGAGARSSDFRA